MSGMFVRPDQSATHRYIQLASGQIVGVPIQQSLQAMVTTVISLAVVVLSDLKKKSFTTNKWWEQVIPVCVWWEPVTMLKAEVVTTTMTMKKKDRGRYFTSENFINTSENCYKLPPLYLV